MEEHEIIAEAEKFGSLESDTENRLLAALEAFYLNGFPDEQSGDAEAPTGHFYRVGRWIVTTNSQGFHSIDAFDTEDQAREAFVRLEVEYSEWARS